MNAARAKYENGQIVLTEAVDWPEGTELSVEPLSTNGDDSADQLSDDTESIARWLKWYDSVQPLVFTAEEEADLAAWRQKVKAYTIQTMDRDIQGLFP